MIAQPPAAIGSFLILAGGLLFTTLAPPKRDYWVGEIQGTSMSPTLCGERVTFNCRYCGTRLIFDRETADRLALHRCDQCQTWQIVAKTAIQLRAYRVVIAPLPKDHAVPLGAIVAINHPKFGKTIKRISALQGDQYFVIGDSQHSTDSRNPEFGTIQQSQILGIVVKILPTIPLAPPKRSR
jgi:hypothetical protein